MSTLKGALLGFVVFLVQPLVFAEQPKVYSAAGMSNVVEIAAGSKDHSTLVTAVKTADLVTVLSNPGPFTVFAPTNEAFAKLPPGTVEDLLKPENREKLQNILEYHVYVGVLKGGLLKNGSEFGQANGDTIRVSVKDGKVKVNDATISGSITASNGVVHVIDTVLIPSQKK